MITEKLITFWISLLTLFLFLFFQGQVRVSSQDSPLSIWRRVRGKDHSQAETRGRHDARDPARGGRARPLRGVHARRQSTRGENTLHTLVLKQKQS